MPAKLEIDFVHTGPGTLAGRYLRSFWQPVLRAEEIQPGHALPVRIMSEDLTLYRGDDAASHLVASHCAHRGTQLSIGYVEGACIRCRYHGWKYDGTGQCVEQPDETIPFPQKIRIKAYPTVEYLGLIFAYLGEGEPPAFRRFEAFEREGIVKVGITEIWPCNFFSRCENTVDTAHVNWAHRATIERLKLEKQVLHRVPTSAEETAFGIRHVMTLSDGRTPKIEFHMPNISHVKPAGRVEGSKEDEATITVDRLFFYVPIDDENCMTFVVDFIPLTGEAATAYLSRAMLDRSLTAESANEIAASILAGKMRLTDLPLEMSSYYSFWIEDYITLVGQGAIPDRQSERLGRTDIGPILLRKCWERELKALAINKPLKQWA